MMTPHIGPKGKPCYCGFHRPEPMWKEAAKIDWLKERPDKYLQSEEGQKVLQLFDEWVGHDDRIDPLLPWIVREIKKGNIQVHENLNGRTRLYGQRGPLADALDPDQLFYFVEYLAEKKKRREGIDLMQLSYQELADPVYDWREEQEQEETRRDYGTIVYDFENGYTIRKLETREDCEYESDEMGHCVARDYSADVEAGYKDIYSLRDPDNHVHATIQVDNGEIIQLEGQGGHGVPPNQEYMEMVEEWANSEGIRNMVGISLEDAGYDTYYLIEIDHVDTLLASHEDPYEVPEWEEAFAAMAYADENGIEDPEVEVTIDWEEIIAEIGMNADLAQKVYAAALTGGRGYFQLYPALLQGEIAQWGTPEQQAMWQGVIDKFVNPQTGRPETFRDEATNQQLPYWNKINEPLFQWEWPSDAPNWPPRNPEVTGQPGQGQWVYSSSPLYYRWTFNPQTGEVHLSHNQEDSPRLHGDFERELNVRDLIHGFAYPIEGGMRITDREHKPMDDPFVTNKVIDSLQGGWDGLEESEDIEFGHPVW